MLKRGSCSQEGSETLSSSHDSIGSLYSGLLISGLLIFSGVRGSAAFWRLPGDSGTSISSARIWLRIWADVGPIVLPVSCAAHDKSVAPLKQSSVQKVWQPKQKRSGRGRLGWTMLSPSSVSAASASASERKTIATCQWGDGVRMDAPMPKCGGAVPILGGGQ